MRESAFEPEFANWLLGVMIDNGDTDSTKIRRRTKTEASEAKINIHLRYILDNYPGLIREDENFLNSPHPIVICRGEESLRIKAFLDSDGFVALAKNEKETTRLTTDKLRLDVANARRIYRTYWLTFALAVIGAGVSLTLLVLKLREQSGK